MGSDLCNIFPISSSREETIDDSSNSRRSSFTTSTISGDVRSILVILDKFVPKKFILIIVVFQGYEVFSRHDPFWGTVADSWGYTIAPWLALLAIAMLVLAWLWKENYKQAGWNWGVPGLRRVNFNGVAPLVEEDEKDSNVFKRRWIWALNTI